MQKPQQRLTTLFLLITGIGVAHMAEQLVFGIDEFRMFQGLVESYLALFPARAAGHASVLLITIVFATVSLMIYALLLGRKPALLVVASFGLLGVGEAHHCLEAIEKGGYDPGLATSFAYVWVGALLLKEVWRQLRRQPARAPVAA